MKTEIIEIGIGVFVRVLACDCKVEMAACLCPPTRCNGCIRQKANDIIPQNSDHCAYQCPVWRALKAQGK